LAAVALAEMSEDTFRYHASREKNDFSSWIRDVIGDETLAGELAKTAWLVPVADRPSL
jgi:hypothetical protein